MAEEKQNAPKQPMSRKAKKRLFSVGITVLVVIAMILVNAIAVTLTEKFTAFTADMTYMKSFELTEQSVQLAQSLGKHVTITFLSEKRDYENRDPYCKQTSVLANELSKYSDGMITVEYVDIVTNPTFVNDYTSEDNLTANDVVVSCGAKKKLLKVSDLFTFEAYTTEYQYIASSQSEQVIDNAIMTVTSDIVTKTAIVSDNSTQEYTYFVSTLNSNNYEVSELSLEKDEIPGDLQMIIIYQPQKDFSTEALIKLDDFMMNEGKYGKNLVYIPDINNISHPNLDEFINAFGLTVQDGVAFEYDSASRYYESDYYEYIFCDFASNLYRENFPQEKYTPVMTGVSRPIAITKSNGTPLLVLSEKSGICPYDADENSWSMEEAVTKNVCVMAQSLIGTEETQSSLTVIGSGDMLSQVYFSNTTGNQTYIMTMLADLNGRDSETVSVADKVITNFDIELNAQARFWIGFGLYALLPLMILGVGLTVFLMRRGG